MVLFTIWIYISSTSVYALLFLSGTSISSSWEMKFGLSYALTYRGTQVGLLLSTCLVSIFPLKKWLRLTLVVGSLDLYHSMTQLWLCKIIMFLEAWLSAKNVSWTVNLKKSRQYVEIVESDHCESTNYLICVFSSGDNFWQQPRLGSCWLTAGLGLDVPSSQAMWGMGHTHSLCVLLGSVFFLILTHLTNHWIFPCTGRFLCC